MVSVIKARSRANPSVEPSLGWTYLSREALARAKAQMDEESTGVRDEIGFLTIRSEEHTFELQSLMRISYAVFCMKKNKSTLFNTFSPSLTAAPTLGSNHFSLPISHTHL